MDNKNILIIDDDPSFPKLIGSVLENEGYKVDIAQDGLDGIKKVKERQYDLVYCDMVMPRLSGPQTIVEIKKFWPKAKICIMSGYYHEGAKDYFESDMACKIERVLHKPFSTEKIIELTKELIGDAS